MEQKIREFDKWYEQYVDELFSYGMAFGMEKEYVLDVIHDVFLHLYESVNKIEMPEEDLLLEANKWELSHGGLSGRTAQQFIDYLMGQN